MVDQTVVEHAVVEAFKACYGPEVPVFDQPWDRCRMSDAVRLKLGPL